MARRTSAGAKKKDTVAKTHVPRAVAQTRASSAQPTPPVVAQMWASSAQLTPPPVSDVIQGPTADAAAEIMALQGGFSLDCVHMCLLFFFVCF